MVSILYRLLVPVMLVACVSAFRVVHEPTIAVRPSLEAAIASSLRLQELSTTVTVPPREPSAAALDSQQTSSNGPSFLTPQRTPDSHNHDENMGPWIEQISTWPRAYVYHNFLTTDETHHLIALASPHLAKSKVIVGETGVVADSTVRTSSGAWIKRGQDAVVSRIEQRVANWTGTPVKNAEPMHVLHYGVDAEYQEHYDVYFDDINLANGGQRIATFIMYLSTVTEGGETVFPLSVNESTPQQQQHLSGCARQGVAARAVRGDALLFYNVLPGGDGQQIDQLSTHAGCPVLKGEKWAATKWIRHQEWIDAPLSQLEAVRRQRETMRQKAAQEQAAAYAEEL